MIATFVLLFGQKNHQLMSTNRICWKNGIITKRGNLDEKENNFGITFTKEGENNVNVDVLEENVEAVKEYAT
ncbi:hypothetical protein ACIQYS_01035 [Psychrobacillus sp. NPDC096426]|uniref:hypothetical protein n=1 Tax=Psychrobacillus sp. NPDC096426 TaxID=3364491 RepID=UPI00380F4C08